MIAPYAEQPDQWTVLKLLKWTEGYFAQLEMDSPRLDAEILLAHALDSSRLELYTEFAKIVEPHERERFRELIKRRARREPVAYITGRREFYSLTFEVDRRVLIPRPETEHLVEAALEGLRDLPGEVRLLDLGTGSGNIGIALAFHLPRAQVDAVDISPDVLEVAQRNAETHDVRSRMQFFCGDLFAALGPGHRPYNAVVSNPPYVSASEYAHLMVDVRDYEPEGALVDSVDPAGDGLGFYRALAAQSSRHLVPDGFLAVEVGHEQASSVSEVLSEASWDVTRVIRDHGGIDRVLVAKPRR